MERPFDAIVVGAGPAGSACAYNLAQAGLEVLLVERGKFAGAKNMWGGAFYGPGLSELLPDFWEEAPYERYVSSQRISALSENASLSVEFKTEKFSQRPYNGIILLRSRFDRWLAGRAEKAGAILACGLQADGLIWDGNCVAGIKAGGDEIRSNVVVVCDGINSLLAQEAGLRAKFEPREVKQSVKEVFQFSRPEIEARFNLAGDEGLAWEFFGSFTKGMPGGAFIYTNKDSLSVGVVVQLSALVEKQQTISEVLDSFKEHKTVAPLLEGGKQVEYSAHLIPVQPLGKTRLYSNGILVAGDAASFILATGLILEGANFALASGVAAAKAVLKAKERNDFSAESLSFYEKFLADGFVLKDLKTFKQAASILENDRLYQTYPKLVCDFAERLLTNDGKPRKHTWRLFTESMKEKVSTYDLIRDVFKGARRL